LDKREGPVFKIGPIIFHLVSLLGHLVFNMSGLLILRL
jgi:hypothetical protein